MKNVLLVSPHFPPTNAPDMQRVRMSLPHFESFGWKPFVLASAPGPCDVVEPLFGETFPRDVHVERVKHVPLSLTRPVGVQNSTIRALPYLYQAGRRLIQTHGIDLVFFSTTMFLTMPLGRVWKQQLGVPYVLDFQDPWLSDYYETHPDVEAPPKYGTARRVHAVMEPWTMKQVDGVVSVSPRYVETLRERYPWVRTLPTQTIPFGASPEDFDVIARHPQTNVHFNRHDGRVHGVYAGRGGKDLTTALDILFRAFGLTRRENPAVFDRVALHFVGTDYAPADRAQKTIEPVAERAGVSQWVDEDPKRLPYFETLQLLEDADFLMIVGSDDPSYSASKVYPYILAGKPLLAIVHADSPLADVIRKTRAGIVITFRSSATADERATAAAQLAADWHHLLETRQSPEIDWRYFERYTARETTRLQCELFDRVVAHHAIAKAS